MGAIIHQRWLKAPVQLEDGSLIHREKGTPQGGVISSLLANLFLHYAFDKWMQRQHPQIPFERYADDEICHCQSRSQAEGLRTVIGRRFAECGLELNLQKTRIVYYKDDKRKGNYPEQKFDFLGYTFRRRKAKSCLDILFVGFSPAISNEAVKSIRSVLRQWHLTWRTDKSLEDLSHMFNPVIRGWINYYGHFYKSALYATFQHFDHILAWWASRKYKRLRGRNRRACQWVRRIS